MSSLLRSQVDLSRFVPDGGEIVPFEKSEIERSIGERFEGIARTFPDRPAVREPGRVTTYGQLSASVSRVAHALIGRLEGRPGPVALMLDAGAPLFAAMLGALEAGRFYVPLDPRLPAPRLEAIGRDLDAAAVLTDEASLDRVRSLVGDVPVWCVEEIAAGRAASDLAMSVSPDDLAYVLFTSGSTGTPKGVMQSHRNVLHNVRKLVTGLSIRAEDRLTLLSSPSFGASVSDIFGALLTGASICPYALSGDGLRRLPDFLTREAITIYHSVPSVFRSFSSTLDGREDLSSLRIVKLGGEPVLASDFDLYRRRFPKSCLFHVGLGTTEMNVIRQWFANHETPWPGASPLGYAVDETEVVLLDEASRETGEEGEIGVIASTLAVGYWKDPAQTAASFLPVPGRPGARLYRTGDRGRMLPDGCLLYLGRKNAGLKVRGHRVEPAEVEATLLSVPGVAEAVVEGRENRVGIRLVAWLVRRPPDPPGIRDLRRVLRERLPESMVPSTFLFLDALPRTATGKVDRRALPEPGAARPALESAFLEPRDEMEESAAGIFAQVLGLDRIGVEDDFFELGGDSLSAVEALTRLSEKLGAELSAADLLEASTPAALAARARRGGEARPDSLVRLQAGDRRPVFIVPGGGGDGEDLFAARRLARLTGGGFPFLCFRSGPAPHPPVEKLAARCVAQLRAAAPDGPYTLVGDCVGGILAFAMARRLREVGEDVALLALLDTPYPGAGRRLYASLLLRVQWADRLYRRLLYFRERLRYHRGILRALSRGRMAYALRMARVGAQGFAPTVSAGAQEGRDRRASYVGTLLAWRPAPFDGTIRLVESAEGASRGFAAAWSKLTPGSEVVRVPGDHASLILEHGDAVAAALRRWLDFEASVPSGGTARKRSYARRGLARLSEAPRRALRRLLGRPPSDWMGVDGAPHAVRRAPPAEDNRHEVVCFESAGADGDADELDGFLTKLAGTGHRVFRVSLRMRGAGPAYELSERAPGLFEVSLCVPEGDTVGEDLDEDAAFHLFVALDSLRRDLGLGATVSVVREPGWLPLAERMRDERAWALVSPSDWTALPVARPEMGLAVFSQMLEQAFPKISIVVVTYNNRDLNRVCLESLFARTEWPNTEVLVVDNASSDGTRELLVEAAGRHPNLRVIGLEENRGFPAAANAGLAQATGTYLILLNNDTVLTRGWATALLRHLAEDPKLGLVGPVTNAIANAARVEVGYADIVDLPGWAAQWTRAHDGQIFPISMAAFFCVAMRREVFEAVGPLDERFGLGLFEDKDYNRRARAKGWRIGCARDAFVHHWQMASFRRLGREAYFRVFEENRKKYEDKWSEERLSSR